VLHEPLPGDLLVGGALRENEGPIEQLSVYQHHIDSIAHDRGRIELVQADLALVLGPHVHVGEIAVDGHDLALNDGVGGHAVEQGIGNMLHADGVVMAVGRMFHLSTRVLRDDFHDAVDNVVLGQCGRVEVHRVVRLHQPPHGPAGVLRIALDNLFGDLIYVKIFPFFAVFVDPPFGAYRDRGVEVDLHVGIGKHHRPDVPTVHDEALATPALAQEIVHKRTDAHVVGDDTDVFCDGLGADLVGDVDAVHGRAAGPVGKEALVDGRPREIVREPGPALDRAAVAQDQPGDGPVDRARIDIGNPQPLRDLLRHAALARACRTVDGDDDVITAHEECSPAVQCRGRTAHPLRYAARSTKPRP